MSQPKYITQKEIDDKYLSCYSDAYSDFIEAVNWTKQRSDAYWKARVVEEARLAFQAGDQRGWAGCNFTFTGQYGIRPEPLTETEYINQLKERLNVS